MRFSKRVLSLCGVAGLLGGGLAAAPAGELPESDKARKYYVMGVNAYSKGEFKRGKRFFLEVKRLSPRFAPAYRYLGKTYDHVERNYPQAVEYYRAYLYLNDGEGRHYQAVQTRLYQIGTLRLVRRAKKTGGDGWTVPKGMKDTVKRAVQYYNTAGDLYKRKQYRQALNQAVRAVKAVPYLEKALFLAGVSAFKLEQYDPAYRYLTEASTLNHKRAVTLFFLAKLNMDYREEYSLARRYFRRYLSLKGQRERRAAAARMINRIDRFNRLYKRGTEAYGARRYQAALQAFQKAQTHMGANVKTLTAIGKCRQNLKQTEPAVAAFRKAADHRPWDPMVYYNMASILAWAEKPQEARRWLKKGRTYYNAETRSVIKQDQDLQRRLGRDFVLQTISPSSR